MALPSDAVLHFRADLTVGDTTWTNHGSAGGTAAIFAGGTVGTNGGIVTGASAGYARYDDAALETAFPVEQPGTTIIRYINRQAPGTSSLSALSTTNEGNFGQRIRAQVQPRSSDTENRQRYDYRWTGPG
ncbi:MAG: hypothetical protein AAGA99_21045, partial [Actinomycetota bacterium]